MAVLQRLHTAFFLMQRATPPLLPFPSLLNYLFFPMYLPATGKTGEKIISAADSLTNPSKALKSLLIVLDLILDYRWHLHHHPHGRAVLDNNLRAVLG